MRIDPKLEEPTRRILEHAIRDEPAEISTVIRSLGEDRYRECITLCVAIAGYVVVDVLGPDWPSEPGLRKMAEGAARTQMVAELDEAKLYEFMRKAAIGFQTLEDVFSATEDLATLPITMTASLLLGYCPQGRNIGEYLDQIEEALEAADSVKPSVLPAMILRAHRIDAG